MTQAERDRLVALKKAKKKLITQKQAAEEIGTTERHVRGLLRALKRRGDKVVAHALRGLPSNRKISADTEQEAVAILSSPTYRGFGPTPASEYLSKKHDIRVSRETVRAWMIKAKLWRGRKQHVEEIHEWRERRSRFGELVQWDTSDHDWLEGRGEEILLINMIDDATSRWFALFVDSDSTVENMNLLESYVKKHGRPLGFYTDKASIFRTAEKRKRDEPGIDKDQIARKDVCTGLRGALVRVEDRRDGSVAVRFRNRYLSITECAPQPKVSAPKPAETKPRAQPVKRSEWNKNFNLKKAPKLWQVSLRRQN